MLLVGSGCQNGILDPKGPVARHEKTLLLNSTGIMLTIVVPVIIATLIVAWMLDWSSYNALAKPSQYDAPANYHAIPGLYEAILAHSIVSSSPSAQQEIRRAAHLPLNTTRDHRRCWAN